MDDVIVGLATPPGAAGVAVVRMSGADVRSVASALVPALSRSAPLRRMRLCRVVQPQSGELLDRAMVCFMAGPHSYTGEDVVELQTHGGAATVRAVLQACVLAGARMSEPGEFTQRAFVNGRLDLAEAEAVAALVGAQSDRARQVALRQLDGGLGHALRGVRADCIAALAEVEARLDFPDEELQGWPVDQLVSRLQTVAEELDRLVAQAPAGRLAREGARVVIVGRPNVGKSSLLNALVGRSRAIVHPSPGTTRDWLEDDLALGGLHLTIVDTAGQRDTAEDAEALGAQSGLDQARAADLTLFVINAAEGITAEDQRLAERLADATLAWVINQTDRVSDAHVKQLCEQRSHVLGCTSATTGTGVDRLRESLRQRLEGGAADGELPLVSEQRHEAALRQARQHVGSTLALLKDDATEELVALELREATRALGGITGEGVTEDVLEEIFSRFCIGK